MYVRCSKGIHQGNKWGLEDWTLSWLLRCGTLPFCTPWRSARLHDKRLTSRIWNHRRSPRTAASGIWESGRCWLLRVNSLSRAESSIQNFFKERILCGCQQSHMLIRNSIPVLLQEAFYFIGDIQGVMSNRKSGVPESWFLEDILVLCLPKNLGVQLLQEWGIRSRRQSRFLI